MIFEETDQIIYSISNITDNTNKIAAFDLDGTIYLGDKLFDKVLDLIHWLKKNDKLFYFLSNNSSRSTTDYLVKLKKHGLDIAVENIILSQHPTIKYLKNNNYKKVFFNKNKINL